MILKHNHPTCAIIKPCFELQPPTILAEFTPFLVIRIPITITFKDLNSWKKISLTLKVNFLMLITKSFSYQQCNIDMIIPFNSM